MKHTKISMNAEELLNLLRYIHANNQLLIKNKFACQTVNIEGGAGTGKTSCILQFAIENNLELVHLDLEFNNLSYIKQGSLDHLCKLRYLLLGDF